MFTHVELPARSDDPQLSRVPLNRASPLTGVYRHAGKRILDLSLVLAAAPFVILIVAILAVIVACDGSRPFYVQKRVGRNGRIFRLWKLRSMVPDADRHLVRYLAANPAAKAEWDTTQKLRRDPRITRFGHFLRRSSLDELPQLLNVVLGDMSLVGPRPMMVEQRSMYPGTDYFLMRPGLTGLWQVAERNGTTFAARARYDAEYSATLSLRTDLHTLWRTFAVVRKGTGV
ncbi:sugar transferase [Paracoccus sp. Z118]|uniref:sugar transferase n=1 Tax=Paracoccus sp. Z118 TaxID=2851017 RepID=UPI001C2C86FE|nr:sugar transferase [Paracoccus sp. Z118]MBV0892161.1 sugar transferase [Paracoccus sp. Z118]